MLLSFLLKRVIRTGTLEVIDAYGKRHVFCGTAWPRVAIRLHDPALHRKLYTDPDLHVGEAYMDGLLTIEEGSLSDSIPFLRPGSECGRGQFQAHFSQHFIKVINHNSLPSSWV